MTKDKSELREELGITKSELIFMIIFLIICVGMFLFFTHDIVYQMAQSHNQCVLDCIKYNEVADGGTTCVC